MAISQPTLRLSQFAEAQADTFRVELTLGNSAPVRTRFSFELSLQDQEDLRWYLEDYLQYPLDPAPTIAARVETRMKDIGAELFRNVFQSSDDARDLWANLRPRLNDTRVEIITEVRDATAVPWELLRDPRTDEPLALNAQAFVRAPTNPVRRQPHTATQEKIRILLVICRPMAGADVPFRSVASRIVKSLSDEAREIAQLDVLRPPTFEQLSKTLREAKARGEPYHVVHFDGHGTYAELIPPQKDKDDKEYAKLVQEILKGLNKITLGAPRTGKHGYLLFENPQAEQNAMFVDGSSLGKLLVENEVSALVLNACQSAFAEAPTTPLTASESSEVGEQVRAFGSLAQEVMDTGIAGVVAMRYVLYVETAKKFVADLYGALVPGQSLGEAVTFGRKQLAANPQREIAYKPINLQDWSVPIVFETAAIELFPRVGAIRESPIRITLDAESKTRGTEIGLPPRPDVGFFGRDETLLALDRAFDSQSIVLLHAFAGSGKTTTAAEFARWYALTGGITLSGAKGGVEGAILFTSFENYKPLPRVLDTIGQVFGDMLEQAGVHWLALEDAARRDVALQLLKQVPVLWIWDNVEPIAGFPAGTQSAWSDAEQQELKDFLNAARETRAKFLLTSRRDETQWLGLLPRRITIPPMPMQERVQLARGIAEKFGRRITDVDDWTPLLRFTQGNPLTITVVVGEALRKGLKTRLEIGDFVERLRKGETAFADEQSEGRSKSLGASLSYGFENAFSETERKQLALLHFFQGFVDVDALKQMGNLKNIRTGEDFSLPELRGLTRETGIALLDRAAEVGLLTAHGDGCYSIHPALPWYFKNLFEKYYPSEQPTVDSQPSGIIPKSETLAPHAFGSAGVRNPKLSATRAFVQAMGALAVNYARQYESGNRDVIASLIAEEANMLHARQLARLQCWWRLSIETMTGIRSLYGQVGRRADWARLVNDIIPDFVDPATDGPLAGREEEWGLVTEYRVHLAHEARQWAEAERMQRKRVEWERQRVAPALAVSPEKLGEAQRNAIRTLAASLHGLGQIQRELGQRECVKEYKEAAELLHRIGDRAAEAACAFNLGHAYKNIPALRDLAQAERWYKHALEFFDERDHLNRSKGLGQLGLVAYERFAEARDVKKPEAELLQHLNDAVRFSLQVLELTPPNAVDALAVIHNQLANIYAQVHDFDRALPHWREAIRYKEAMGDLYKAGMYRYNVAVALAKAGRLVDAREYALAALRNFETFGDRAAEEIEETKGLIAEIEKLKGKS